MLFVQRAKKPCGFYEICRHKYDKDVIVIVAFGEFRVVLKFWKATIKTTMVDCENMLSLFTCRWTD